MDQLQIEELLDKALTKTESDLEKAFNRRLREILFNLAEMYRKYSKGGELTYTDLNKYNRYQKEMKLIADILTGLYKEIIQTVQSQEEYQYVTKLLMTAYIVEKSVTPGPNLGFSIPSIGTIRQAILNPIAELTLPKILENHRNEIVRKINIEISQGLLAGEGYADIANRIRNAVNFSSKKARLVARTEVGRVRSIANEKVFEQASKFTETRKVWMSMLDLRVRQAHRRLDGQKSDDNGYFHYLALKAKGPRLWGVASMDIQCRCVAILTVNGKLPIYRRERDYMDDNYQRKLASRIDYYMADEGLTYKQAVKKAMKHIQPPQRVIEYEPYEKWFEALPKGA